MARGLGGWSCGGRANKRPYAEPFPTKHSALVAVGLAEPAPARIVATFPAGTRTERGEARAADIVVVREGPNAKHKHTRWYVERRAAGRGPERLGSRCWMNDALAAAVRQA